jgi:uncharacterized protein YneF (UPF0154 family)
MPDWLQVAILVAVLWLAVSLPVGMAVGRFLGGPRREL